MKRFRVTLLVVCFVLSWLGYTDLSLYLRNPSPQGINVDTLRRNGAPREWLKVEGGYRNLLEAINMSGTIEVTSFLVPLKTSENAADAQIWFETRDPKVIDALKTYYFDLDTDAERNKFVDENLKLFKGPFELQGMLVDNLIANTNRNKLKELLTKMDIPVSDQVIFISEGKAPSSLRGIFFVSMALLGFGKLLFDLLKRKKSEIEPVKE